MFAEELGLQYFAPSLNFNAESKVTVKAATKKHNKRLPILMNLLNVTA